MQEVELSRIVYSDHRPECEMYLRDKQNGRVFPVIIDINVMLEIRRKVHGEPARRPMTHDLFAALMAETGVTLERVEITELRDNVFYALMHLHDDSGRSFTLDARPSDAVAIATGVDAPIFASETILDEIGVQEDESEES
jgi:bifunctional DNase/RNase